MEFLKLFTDRAPNRVFLSILLGAIAGASYALLIPIVLTSIANSTAERAANKAMVLGFEVTNYQFGALFAGICLLIMISRSLSQVLLSRVALDATTDLRVKTYRAIMGAPIAEIERLGPSRLMVAITNDVGRIVSGASIVPNVLVALVTVTGMLVYLAFLNIDVFWVVVAGIAFGIITYQIPMYIGNKYFERGRKFVDALQESIRGLIYGTKELKLSKAKRERYFSDILLVNEYAVRDNTKRANTIVMAAANYGDLLSYFVIGVIAYVFVSYHAVEPAKLVGVVMALLYIVGPVGLILNAMPQLAMAKVSLRHIKELFGSLEQEKSVDHVVPIAPWRSLRFNNVCYSYTNGKNSFSLGPIDLEISRGEITFIVGGNGSGKSTLSKLIALHYTPRSGDVHFGETRVDRDSMNSCRQCITAIFTDYYLFDRLLDSFGQDEQATIDRYLRELELDKKVSVEGGKFSTIALSDGQKKRLALLVTFLEGRDMYIFDEWAADQDPRFKEVFYHGILPMLRDMGKAVVVISHDDRYFSVADKVLVMEEGSLLRTEYPQHKRHETSPLERVAAI
ncbi:MAG: cyclic peptide export ABC transporter [Rhodanobacteraceae bacterium]|nr:cyclic peptide export ABC transporter [Rhodanobacteraceae bacterium]